MNLYDKYVLPHLIHCVCQGKTATGQREKIVPLAKGRVLEIGIGSGLNLPYYDAGQVSEVIGIDPASELWNLHNPEAARQDFAVSYIQASAEDIPLESGSVDTVLSTYTLCTIPNLAKALGEIRRVLKPGGRLLFCEHGSSDNRTLQRLQNGINPAWKRLGGGCNLNRDIPFILASNGFSIQQIEQDYLGGWKVAGLNFLGVAIPAGYAAG